MNKTSFTAWRGNSLYPIMYKYFMNSSIMRFPSNKRKMARSLDLRVDRTAFSVLFNSRIKSEPKTRHLCRLQKIKVKIILTERGETNKIL